MNLWKKFNITIYNQDGYSHLLYKLAKGEAKVKYCNNLEWLEKHNSDDPVRQVAVALYVSRVMKFIDASFSLYASAFRLTLSKLMSVELSEVLEFERVDVLSDKLKGNFTDWL